MKNPLLNLLLCFMLFSGCTATYNITIKTDYSAHVYFTIEIGSSESSNYTGLDLKDTNELRMATDTLKEFYNSDLISNLNISDENGRWIIEYDISTIDSLGNFLNPFSFLEYPIEFSHTENSIMIVGSDGNSNPSEDICGCTDLIRTNITLNFEKEIKKVVSKNPYVKMTNSKTVIIETSIGEMNYSGIENKIEVKLK